MLLCNPFCFTSVVSFTTIPYQLFLFLPTLDKAQGIGEVVRPCPPVYVRLFEPSLSLPSPLGRLLPNNYPSTPSNALLLGLLSSLLCKTPTPLLLKANYSWSLSPLPARHRQSYRVLQAESRFILHTHKALKEADGSIHGDR